MPARARLRHLLTVPLLTLLVVLSASAFGPAGQASAAGRHHHHRHHHHHAAHHHAAAPAGGRVARATQIALSKVGDPYRYGAAGPGSFDCSGLVAYSYGRAGIRVPRTAAAQSGRARHISKKQLRRGDLMFFTNGSHVYHVAIFLGWNHGAAQMLHSPRPGQRVSRSVAWTSSWFAGTLR